MSWQVEAFKAVEFMEIHHNQNFETKHFVCFPTLKKFLRKIFQNKMRIRIVLTKKPQPLKLQRKKYERNWINKT